MFDLDLYIPYSRGMGTYQNTKVKGNSAELEAACFFNRNGYVVSLPFGDNAPYDAIVESPSRKIYRVQVRWSSWKGEILMVNLQRSSQGRSYSLDLSRIDVFAIWDGSCMFIVPTSELSGCIKAFTLRRGASKNGQKQGIHLAKDYEGATARIP